MRPRIAVADRDGAAVFLYGVEIYGHAIRRADLVLAAIALADRARLVLFDAGDAFGKFRTEDLIDLASFAREGFFILEERKDGDFDRRDGGREL